MLLPEESVIFHQQLTPGDGDSHNSVNKDEQGDTEGPLAPGRKLSLPESTWNQSVLTSVDV